MILPVYPLLAVVSAVAVIALELVVLRSGIFKQAAYWLSMAICLGFMIPVDGWLTKLSAPIVTYRPEDTSGIRPIWDIPLEEFAYAFALLTLVMLVWDRAGRHQRDGGDADPDTRAEHPITGTAAQPATTGAATDTADPAPADRRAGVPIGSGHPPARREDAG